MKEEIMNIITKEESKMKSINVGKSTLLKFRLLSNFLKIFLSVAVVTFYSLPAAVAQEKQEQYDVSKEEVEKYKEVKKAAKKEKVETAAKQDATGTDPRVFSDKWMPYYRYTELENGLIQQDLTAFGTFGFSDRVGMFYEIPLAQYRDFSDVPGVPSGTDAIGMGDIDLKFLWRPKALEFSYGKEGKKSASVLLGTDFLLPTATDDALAGDALLFAPIVAFVWDMPFYGFVAMLNLYFFDVYKEDSAPKTSRYVGKWFYMQPLTKPGPWWGGLFLLPEFQPIYDFETNDFSAWIGLELGKMLAPGRIAYIKPGWGIDNSETTDRKSTIEVGFRWFF
ncbi:MAG: hypothetical protein JRJ46_11365 [Deltaproteobacteria bacterium]|nr:hypothetical protein [Deltaproteobacteria bacterium]